MHLLYCPCPDPASAEHLARALLDAQLAACVNVLPGLQSYYRWQGEICCDPEVLLLAKTDPAHSQAAQSCIEAQHPYDCPVVLRLDAALNPLAHTWLRDALA